jgi:hypothetical protein
MQTLKNIREEGKASSVMNLQQRRIQLSKRVKHSHSQMPGTPSPGEKKHDRQMNWLKQQK